jgi:predicted  nucleic acid-binding Zn-ribbon protein
MTQQTPEMPPKKNNKKDALYITLIVLLLISNGFMVWMYMDAQKHIENKNTEISELNVEKTNLENELKEMLMQYDTLKSNNEQLNAELEAQRAKIKELLAQVEKHKNDAYIIYKLKKEAATLREIMKGYIHQIDSLNQLNQKLIQEKNQITQELHKEKEQKQKLEEINEELVDKVKTGSRLRAYNIVATALRMKSNGVLRETTRANRTEKIKTCFTLDKNPLTKPGDKVVFARILMPNGDLMPSPDGGTFKADEQEIPYSLKRDYYYENQAIDICVFYDVANKLESGTYKIELYTEGALIGTTELTLK